MKSILYIFFLLPILFSCQAEKTVTVYPNQVGDIVFDKSKDDPAFKRCMNKDYGIQYYNDSKGYQYNGEKIAIIQALDHLKLSSSQKINGSITIRFLVNCEGTTGLFRVQQMDENYTEAHFDKEFVEKILDFTKSLNGWLPKEYQGHKIDYYQYLTYKIENGKIAEILP